MNKTNFIDKLRLLKAFPSFVLYFLLIIYLRKNEMHLQNVNQLFSRQAQAFLLLPLLQLRN